MFKKINGHESAAARFLFDANGRIRGLRSYATMVIEVNQYGWMRVNGLYSKTTRKHIGWFMKHIGSSYQTAKQLYEEKTIMNIYTGEVQAA